MHFEWDPEKHKTNRAKHGVSSDAEDRFVAVGPIQRGVIVVAHTERDDGVLRLVSARMATKKERQRYEESQSERHERRDS